MYLAMSIRKYGYCYTATPPVRKTLSHFQILCARYHTSVLSILAKPSPIDEKDFSEISLGEASKSVNCDSFIYPADIPRLLANPKQLGVLELNQTEGPYRQYINKMY